MNDVFDDIDDAPDAGPEWIPTMYEMGVLGYDAQQIAMLFRYDEVATIQFMSDFGDQSSEIYIQYQQGVAQAAYARDRAMGKAAIDDVTVYDAIDMRKLVKQEMLERQQMMDELYEDKMNEPDVEDIDYLEE